MTTPLLILAAASFACVGVGATMVIRRRARHQPQEPQDPDQQQKDNRQNLHGQLLPFPAGGGFFEDWEGSAPVCREPCICVNSICAAVPPARA